MPAPKGNQYAKGNKGGRPSSYKPEFAKIAAQMSRLGATDQDLAKAFGVAISTIVCWRATHEEFSSALRVGKDEADARVERSLFQRAVGYSYDSEKVFQFQGQVIRAPLVEHVPPDTTAQIFWLKNRRPDLWRDKVHQELSGAVTLESLVAASMAKAPAKSE